MGVNQHDDNDDNAVENDSLKPLSLSEVNFDQLSKLYGIAYESKVSDAMYHLRKLKDVISKAEKDKMKSAKEQHLILKMFRRKNNLSFLLPPFQNK